MRIRQLREILTEAAADAVVVTRLSDVRWLTGFSGSNGIVVVTTGDACFYTDSRYDIQARYEVRNCDVQISAARGIEALHTHDLLNGTSHVLIQSDALTIDQYAYAAESWPAVEWVKTSGLLAGLRASKNPAEIALIEEAQRVSEGILDDILDRLKEGITERQLAADITAMATERSEGISFDPIAAGGPNAALPHAKPTDRPVAAGDLVLLDFGCRVDGYCSDMTRTVAVGEPGDEAREAYALVLRALRAATDQARSGIAGSELDYVARSLIRDAGYGDRFNHSLGHGVGLDVHEMPRLSERSKDVLPESAVITLEPGVYFEDSFGIRIEDMVVLGANGARNLTLAPAELIVL